MGAEQFGKMAGNIEALRIPAFIADLAKLLNAAEELDFATWRVNHKAEYMDLIKSYE